MSRYYRVYLEGWFQFRKLPQVMAKLKGKYGKFHSKFINADPKDAEKYYQFVHLFRKFHKKYDDLKFNIQDIGLSSYPLAKLFLNEMDTIIRRYDGKTSNYQSYKTSYTQNDYELESLFNHFHRIEGLLRNEITNVYLNLEALIKSRRHLKNTQSAKAFKKMLKMDGGSMSVDSGLFNYIKFNFSSLWTYDLSYIDEDDFKRLYLFINVSDSIYEDYLQQWAFDFDPNIDYLELLATGKRKNKTNTSKSTLSSKSAQRELLSVSEFDKKMYRVYESFFNYLSKIYAILEKCANINAVSQQSSSSSSSSTSYSDTSDSSDTSFL